MAAERTTAEGEAQRASGESEAEPQAPATHLRPEHLYKAVALLFLFLVFQAQFGPISRILLIVYAAAILAVALNVLVGLVPRHRTIVTAGLGLVIFAGIGVSFWLGVPALAGQLRGLAGELPRLREQLERWSVQLQEITGLNVEVFGEQSRQIASSMVADAQVLGTATGLIEGLALPLVIIVGGLYAVAKPNDRLLSPLLHVVPRSRRDDFRQVLELLGARLRGWVKGTLLAMLAVGLLATVGLWLLGVRYALLLGLISALLEIVPIVGPWVAGAIAVGVALLDGPTTALWVALLMFGIQQLESNVITPLVMAQAAEVHPFVTLFALFLFGTMFGFLGIILALPLVLLVWTVVEVLWVGRAIGAKGEHIDPIVKP